MNTKLDLAARFILILNSFHAQKYDNIEFSILTVVFSEKKQKGNALYSRQAV